jgi:bloom syndrome protein
MYEIRDKKNIKNIEFDLSQLLTTRFKNKCGIIYCITRKQCEKLSENLKRNYKIKCDFYHADLPIDKRTEVQAKWMKNEILVIVATVAFGMGINKKDVRFVVHFSIPKSLESYS